MNVDFFYFNPHSQNTGMMNQVFEIDMSFATSIQNNQTVSPQIIRYFYPQSSAIKWFPASPRQAIKNNVHLRIALTSPTWSDKPIKSPKNAVRRRRYFFGRIYVDTDIAELVVQICVRF